MQQNVGPKTCAAVDAWIEIVSAFGEWRSSVDFGAGWFDRE